MSALKSIRYLIIRSISCPVPFLSNKIPIIGGRTLVEVFCVLLFGAVMIAFGLRTGGNPAGFIAEG
jgi:hypothetical protein